MASSFLRNGSDNNRFGHFTNGQTREYRTRIVDIRQVFHLNEVKCDRNESNVWFHSHRKCKFQRRTELWCKKSGRETDVRFIFQREDVEDVEQFIRHWNHKTMRMLQSMNRVSFRFQSFHFSWFVEMAACESDTNDRTMISLLSVHLSKSNTQCMCNRYVLWTLNQYDQLQ